MKKICFIVQRYGADIVGGSESYCRQIARRLAGFYDIEILTTKAKDPSTWHDEYVDDVELIDGLIVRRFSVEHDQMVTQEMRDIYLREDATIEQGYEWMEAIGPYSPSLLEYLSEHIEDYDAIVLMTYLYYPTVMAALDCGRKCMMIPTAHDEAYIYQPIYKKAFDSVSKLYFLTPEERAFFEQKFNVPHEKMSDGHGGVGVVAPSGLDIKGFREKYNLKDAPFILYAGRIEEGKGCKNLIRYYMEYKGRNPSELKLVLIGKQGMDIPDREDIVYLGFLSDEEKFSAMKAADVFVNPSAFESLSIVALEAMQMGTPLLVNGRCEVLKGHCKRSNGGFYYTNFLEFEALLNLLRSDEHMYSFMKSNAQRYVETSYTWDTILGGLRKNIDEVIDLCVDKPSL